MYSLCYMCVCVCVCAYTVCVHMHVCVYCMCVCVGVCALVLMRERNMIQKSSRLYNSSHQPLCFYIYFCTRAVTEKHYAVSLQTIQTNRVLKVLLGSDNSYFCIHSGWNHRSYLVLF